MSLHVLEHPQSSMVADLIRSGLTDKDAKKLHLKVRTSDEMLEITGRSKIKSRAVEFPYFDVNGKDTGTRRYRFLDDVRGFGEKKGQRYYQPPLTLPRVYFPPTRDWAKVAGNIAQEVWITEGEKKAAKACKEGLACMAFGGIYSFMSKKYGVMLLSELANFPWKGRTAKLCFDTDAIPNPQVELAQTVLVRRLEHLGAKVFVVKLPLIKDATKTGLDDFLVAKGKKALLKIDPAAKEVSTALHRLNEELVLINNPAAIYHPATRQLVNDYRPLTQFLYASWKVLAQAADGSVREVNAVPEWAKWDGARRCERLVFEPGCPQITEGNEFNLWAPSTLEPKRGDVSLFRELLDYLGSGLSVDHRKWLLQWVAFMFQHPGVKMYSAVVLWSEAQGNGKTLFSETIGRLFGPYFGVINQTILHSAFNGWQENRQFVLGNEITGTERRQDADRIKDIITNETVTINVKYKAPYTVRDCSNYIFTSNRFNAFLLDREDRRFFIVEAGHDMEPPSETWFSKKYDPWAKSEEGQAALLYYLLHVDLDGFNPAGKAPQTSAKEEMAAASLTEVEAYMADVLRAPDQYLRFGIEPLPRDLFTTQELIAILDSDRRYHLRTQNMSHALKKAGAVKLESTRTTSSTNTRLWAMRNQEKWLAAGHKERADHYDAAAPSTKAT